MMDIEKLIITSKNISQEFVPFWVLETLTITDYNPLLFSAIGSFLVGLSGILPLLILPENLKNGGRCILINSFCFIKNKQPNLTLLYCHNINVL